MGSWPKWRLTLEGALASVSPSDFATKTGDQYASSNALFYGVELGDRFSDSIEGTLSADLFSLSAKSNSTGVSDGAFASGFNLTAGLDYLMVNGHSFTFGPGIGLGIGLASAGNNNGSIKKTTSGVMAPLYLIRLDGAWRFADSFALRFGLGYRVQTLTAIPVTTLSSSSATADLSMSGVYGGIGLSYLF
jgi:hypothetical protein